MKRCVLLSIIFTCLLLPAMDRAHFIELNQKGREQAKQRDWKGVRETLVEIGKELQWPTPRYILRTASVEMHLGNTAEAIRWMQKYADMGLTYDIAQDDDLKPLASDPAFAAVADAMKHNAQPLESGESVCALPMTDLMPEDLTFDKNSGSFVVSSIQHHSLFRVKLPKADSGECELKEIPLDDSAKRWPTLAVSADPARNLLWMTAAAMPGFVGFAKEDEGKSALIAIDSATGKTVHRFDLVTTPGVLGDMSVAKDGTVYVSDSVGGGVYRVRGDLKTATLEKVGDFFSPQTPAVSGDGKRLFVSDYPVGIGIVDLEQPAAAGKLTYLAHPDSVAVTGLDGVYLLGDSLIGVQNGVEPVRIIRFRLNQAQTAIISAEVMEQSTRRLGEPTHVFQMNGWFYVTANVGWDKIDDSGKLKPGEHFTAPVLLRFRDPSVVSKPKPMRKLRGRH